MPFTISDENVEYRGEGNKGLVITLKKEERVLKLLKQENDSEVTRNVECFRKELERQVEIVENVMKPLLGETFVNSPEVIFLSKEDIRKINSIVRTCRPGNRQHKSVKEEDTYALLLPDYCSLPPHLKILPSYGPVIGIEIKPKQGFILSNSEVSSQSSNSRQFCRFCLMQQYKLRRGMISCESGYCPTDLFSGCQERMFHAMNMLLKTPQNNFRLFKNQKLVYSEERRTDLEELLSDFFIPHHKLGNENKSCSDLLCDLVIKTLLKTFSDEAYGSLIHLQKKVAQDCANCYPCSHNDCCCELPPDCILKKVLNVQTLDNLELLKLYSLFLDLLENSNQSSDSIGCLSRSEIPPYLGEYLKTANESKFQYASRKVWEFLVALTMKDCSIMLVLKNVSACESSSRVISDVNGNLYLLSIAIADLDAKSIDKVEKFYKEMPYIMGSC